MRRCTHESKESAIEKHWVYHPLLLVLLLELAAS